MRELLKLTLNAIIVEATKNDSEWADHNDGTGTNHLGIMYMELQIEYKTGCTKAEAQKQAYNHYQKFNKYRANNHSKKSLYEFPPYLLEKNAKNNIAQTKTAEVSHQTKKVVAPPKNPQAIHQTAKKNLSV